MHKIYLDWKVGWCREIDQPVVDLWKQLYQERFNWTIKKLKNYKTISMLIITCAMNGWKMYIGSTVQY